MHENNPLHTFTTAVHVSVVAFAMNARYPGQFPNCSERQTRRMKERELDDRRATRTANLIERERQRERWRRLENGGKGRRRERKLFSAMLRALQKHTVSLSLSLSTPRSSSSFSTSIPSPPLLAISSPFRDVCNRFERLERPREPTRASAFSVYHRLPSIFTIFTSRPRDPTAYNQTSRSEEKGTWDPLPTFPSLDVPPRVIAAYFHYLRPRSRVERIFDHAWKSMDRLYKIS